MNKRGSEVGSSGQLSFGDLPRQPPARPKRIYPVSEIVGLASRTLASRFGDVWIEGEVSGLRRPRSGHCYFTLKDGSAQLSSVMFAGAARRLKFELEDGQELRCRGRLGIYEARGQFQFVAEAAEPTGVGALQLAFEQLKAKLEAEGLFDPARRKPLPRIPRRIAVVTSPTGAAIRDIVRVLHRRFPVRVVVCPTLVQGDGAPVQVARAVGRADRLGADLMIVSRGGGSLEDLWAFNTEEVARAVFAAKTPVISGVGHEVDTTIVDLVADKRAATPSNAAELAVPVEEELREYLVLQRRRMVRSLRSCVDKRALFLEKCRRRLGTPRDVLNRSRQDLDGLVARLEDLTEANLRRGRDRLDRLARRLAAQEPRLRLGRGRADLQRLEQQLDSAMRRSLDRRRHGLGRAGARLDAMSPLAVLGRGYSVMLDQQGKAVRRSDQLQPGDRVRVRLHQGGARCQVVDLDPPGSTG